MSLIKHGPCEACGSRDNRAEYVNGWWCFGCGKYTPKQDNESLRKRLENTTTYGKSCEKLTTTNTLPLVAEQWLSKYGLTKEEKAQFSWCEDQNLLILLQDENYWQGRNFAIGSKYLSRGNKPIKLFGKSLNSETIIFTEDVISAIKVSRFVTSCPLLGSTIGLDKILSLSGGFNHYFLWLDMDKAKESVKQAKIASQAWPNCSVIITELDPKEYTTVELKKILTDKDIKICF